MPQESELLKSEHNRSSNLFVKFSQQNFGAEKFFPLPVIILLHTSD